MRWRVPLFAIVAAGALFGPAEYAKAAVPTGPALAANCTNPSTIAFPGGVQVQMTCDGRQVGGVGTTIPDAEINARAFADLAAQTAVRCTLPSVLSTSNVSAVPGGFVIRFNCDGATVSGFGSTATDTGVNLLAFASVLATDNLRCNTSSSGISAVPGGFLASFQCGGVTLTGFGSTATDAGVNANGFAMLRADSGIICSITSSSIAAVMGGFIPTFACSGSHVSGFGSTAADAGRNALGFAQLKAATGRACMLPVSGVKILAYSYEAQFNCGSRHPVGTGTTATAAGASALVAAQ